MDVPGFKLHQLRLLALFRFWNMIQYWFPYRDVIGEPWDGVLREFIPRLAAAQDRDAYALALATLIARVNDTHAQLGDAGVLPPRGDCRMPVGIRFIEERPTVTAHTNVEAARASGIEIGDVIVAVAGEPVEQLVAEWMPYHSASNEATKLRLIARYRAANAAACRFECCAGVVLSTLRSSAWRRERLTCR